MVDRMTVADFYGAALDGLTIGVPGLSQSGREAVARNIALRCRAALRTADTGRGAEPPWQPATTAPYDREFEVQAGGMTFRAKLVRDGSMTTDEETCDQWQATREGEHPPCWSDGACWASNEDEVESLQVRGWREVVEDGARADAGWGGAKGMREAAAKVCQDEATACINDIRPDDAEGALLAYARAGALMTAAGDIRALPGAGRVALADPATESGGGAS